MPIPLLAMGLIAGGTALAGVASGYFASEAAKDAAETQGDAAISAAEIQAGAAQQGIEEQRRQFESLQSLMNPFVEAGTGALQQQQALAGTLGPEAQQQAIQNIQAGPEFGAITQQGENAILQSAAATGGLRGGNIQSSLAQFRPQVLSGLINQKFSQLGGLVNAGQSAAGGISQAGQATGANVSNLLSQSGQAQAQGVLGQGQAAANAQLAQGKFLSSIPSSIAGGLGTFAGLGGFGGGGVNPAAGGI